MSSAAAALGLPSWPPTEVRKWLTCPVYWQLSKRWTPRVESWQPHKLVGSALHLGIASYLGSVRDGAPALSLYETSGHDALQLLEAEFQEQETWSLEALQALVRKGIALAIKGIERDLLPGATIRGVEVTDPINPLPPGVRVPRIIDCILERAGALEVWDWKSHIKLDPQYLGERQRSIIHSWQLLDYGWHAQEWFGKPVTLVGTGEIILTPKAQFLPVPVVVIPARLAQWRMDAEQIWHMMATIPDWHNWEACTDRHLFYGKECEFVPGCHQLSGDETLFSGVYKVRES